MRKKVKVIIEIICYSPPEYYKGKERKEWLMDSIKFEFKKLDYDFNILKIEEHNEGF